MWIYSPNVNFVRTRLLDLFLQLLGGVERLVPDINIIMQCEWELPPLKVILRHYKKKADHIVSYIAHYTAETELWLKKPQVPCSPLQWTHKERQANFWPKCHQDKGLIGCPLVISVSCTHIVYTPTQIKLPYLERRLSCGACIKNDVANLEGGHGGILQLKNHWVIPVCHPAAPNGLAPHSWILSNGSSSTYAQRYFPYGTLLLKLSPAISLPPSPARCSIAFLISFRFPRPHASGAQTFQPHILPSP